MVALCEGHLSLFWKSNTYHRSVPIDTSPGEAVCLGWLVKERDSTAQNTVPKPSGVFTFGQMRWRIIVNLYLSSERGDGFKYLQTSPTDTRSTDT